LKITTARLDVFDSLKGELILFSNASNRHFCKKRVKNFCSEFLIFVCSYISVNVCFCFTFHATIATNTTIAYYDMVVLALTLKT